MLIKKILVALDGSEESTKALEYAVDFAEETSSEIQLITVVPPVFLPTYSHYVLKSRSITDCQKELETSFNGISRSAQSYLEKNKPELRVSTKLSSGFPHEEIVKTAKQGNFDLIIMGSRGLGGRISFQGSVSSRVIDEAPCPVLVIKKTCIQSTLRRPASIRRSKKMLAGLSA